MIWHVFSEALNALSHYKLRSALTMLSVIWGVASLMLLLSYGQGFGLALTRAFDQIGKDLIVIFPGQTSLQAGGERSGRRILLELDDVQAIREGVPTVEAISPEVRRFLPVSLGYRVRDYSIAGVYAAFERIRGTELDTGRFLSEDDVLHRRRVAVIGATLKTELFSGRPAVGSEVKINGVRFAVIGVLKKKTQITNYNMPDDMTAFVPYTSLSTLMDIRYLNNIVVLPVSNRFRDRLIPDLRAALARAHNFNVRDERAVEILDWNKFRGLVENLSLGLNLLLTIIGALTLSIGAVGVMNIMLVSVTERTREIGVLKALGARRRHILAQILLEGTTLTAAGGLGGFLLAAGITRLIGSLPLLGPLFEDTSGQGDVHLGISFSALLISSGVLIAVGLVSGLIPAIRAARLDPVQAIRSE
jgi:putative ABC transport system permease protein